MNEESKIEEIVPKKKFNIRRFLVIVVILFFVIATFISSRTEYLKVKEIGENYTSIFLKNFSLKCAMFGISFAVTYLLFYINNKIIKKGMKRFFDEENRKIPKLPNKSLSLVFGILAGICASKFLYTKYIMCVNATSFGTVDKVFGNDIGFYIFILPFIKTMLIYLIVVALVMVIYTAIYYVISINVCFENGVDLQSLKKNIFIKQVKFWAIIFALLISSYIVFDSQDILTGKMLSIKDESGTELTGAGLADTFIKLWGYRIFAVIVFVSVIKIIQNASASKFKKCISSASIIPIYLVCMFGVLIYFQEIYVGSSELDKEKTYIGYNIEATKEAYGIEIEQKQIENSDTITSNEVSENLEVLNNIPLINETVINKTVTDTQDNSTYYNYNHSNLGLYKQNGITRLLSLTVREIFNDSNRSYNNKTFEYTHGYSVVATDPNTVDKNGYVQMVQSSFKDSEENVLDIEEPRIYFGMETNSTIITNSKYGKEFDYPITSTTYEENEYDGNAGLKLGLIDRAVVGISTGNYRMILSKYLDSNSKVIMNRNILDRVKTLLPYIEYDEDPYLVVTSEGKLVWIIDGYTTSCEYPYSQITTITKNNGMKEKINYIRNSVKVLVDAYDGTTEFYITDRDDPIIMMYNNLYPELFMDIDKGLPETVKTNIKYSKYLFDVQSKVLETYHEISEDILYRADDVWTLATDGTDKISSKYTMLKLPNSTTSNFGIVSTYTKSGKESLTSYLVGTCENGKTKLSLYKFSAESSIIGVSQLNSLIEENESISSVLKSLDVSGVDMVKDIIIVPIGNSLLYVEPVYQVRLNELETQILKKVIVSSGNKVAIGDTLEDAMKNLLSENNSVKLEYVDMEDINQVIDSIVEANSNLKESLKSQDLEMLGKDLDTLQTLLDQLEVLRSQELEKQNSKGENYEFSK